MSQRLITNDYIYDAAPSLFFFQMSVQYRTMHTLNTLVTSRNMEKKHNVSEMEGEEIKIFKGNNFVFAKRN